MGLITKKQREEFFELYKQGYRSKAIYKRVGLSRGYAQMIIRAFDSGDYSWVEGEIRRESNCKSEAEKLAIVLEAKKRDLTNFQLAKKYGITESKIRKLITNYNRFGNCTSKKKEEKKDEQPRTNNQRNERANFRVEQDNNKAEKDNNWIKQEREETQTRDGETEKQGDKVRKKNCISRGMYATLCEDRSKWTSKEYLRAIAKGRAEGLSLKACLAEC